MYCDERCDAEKFHLTYRRFMHDMWVADGTHQTPIYNEKKKNSFSKYSVYYLSQAVVPYFGLN
jgi:Fe-S cluster biosynthesis and repair protein YggX